jgi:energy-coupling factor transporter transmembrane protein EcfT
MWVRQALHHRNGLIQLGTYGHLIAFVWLLAMAMIVLQKNLLVGTALCLVVIAGMYPAVFRRMFNFRLVLLGFILVLPPIFLIGEVDCSFLGIAYSSEGLLVGLRAGVRFWVVLLAVFGFTGAVDIPSLAGALEKIGLQGLGFSIGVALNLVPSLKDAALKSWHSLKMRGGFRKQWLRGAQLYLVVVITNALRQAEEIALAAESRAFSPEKARPMPIQSNWTDWLVLPICVLSFIFILIWI